MALSDVLMENKKNQEKKHIRRFVMKIKNKLKLENKMLLTLDGDILDMNADFVVVDGMKYKYDLAYDMPSTIGVEISEIKSDEVEFT